MSTYTPEQYERLPKWAKAMVREAEVSLRTAQDMRDRAEAMVAEADMLSIDRALDPEHSARLRGQVQVFREFGLDAVPIGRQRDEIHFRTDPDRRTRGFFVRLDTDGTLRVSASDPLSLRLQASNTFHLSLER